LESSHGKNTISQALGIKEIFYDFASDYLVLDVQQAGIAVFDSMSSVTRNDARGVEYPAFTVMDNAFIDDAVRKELQARTLGLNALPCVFPISATQKLNSEIAVAFRAALQKKLFDFLVSDIDAEDHLTKTNREFFETKEDISLRPWFLHPFVQTNLLVAECVNLEMAVINGMIKLSEGGGLKDRYTSISYMNWFVSNVLDRELLKQEDSEDDWSLLQSFTFISK
jgi:hypothetical protein